MVKSLERYMLGKGEYRWLYDKKPNLPRSIRSLLGTISLIILLFPGIYFFSILVGETKIEILPFIIYAFLLKISAAGFAWFNPNCRERIQDRLEKISTLKTKNKHDEVNDEVDMLLNEISDFKDDEYNKFNEIVIEQLGYYIALFIYPILQSKNIKARDLVYNHFIPNLTNIIKNRNKIHEIPKLINDFDDYFMSVNHVKESLFLLYGIDNDFLKQSVSKRIYAHKDLVERIPPALRIIKYISGNERLTTQLIYLFILIFILIIVNYLFPDLRNLLISILPK